MSKFRPGYFDYIKFNKVYYTPVVENVFDLIYRSQFEAVKSQVTKDIVDINSRNDKGQTLYFGTLWLKGRTRSSIN